VHPMAEQIAIYSHSFLPNPGGLERNTDILACALQRLGYQVTVVTRAKIKHTSMPVFPYTVVRQPRFAAYMKLLRQSMLVIVNGGISIPGLLGAMIARKPAMVIHQMAARVISMGNLCKMAKSLLRYPLCYYPSLHIGVSGACLEFDGIREQKTKMVVYNPVHEYYAQHAKKNVQRTKKYDLLYAGRLVKEKGLEVLLSALKQLSFDQRKIEICICGCGRDEEWFEKQCRELKHLNPTFKGYLEIAELANVYAETSVLVLPSQDHPEGCPLVIGEAMTYGIPVIVSDQKANIETAGRAGIEFKSGDGKALGTAIINLLRDKTMYDICSRAAIERAKAFSMESYENNIRDAVNICIENVPNHKSH